MAAMPPAASGAATPSPTSARPERLFTVPAVAFLLLVAALVASGLWQRASAPDLTAACRLLADGDLDGDERKAMLRRIQVLAAGANDATAKWAAHLAAIALEDREAYAASVPGPGELPAAGDRELLHLGDPMLGNVLAAGVAEAAGDREEALRRWRWAEAQSRLASRYFPQELAAAAQLRLARK
jgi:hypothetical protein